MAGDEPRRSGRASKGQHKHLEEVETAARPKKGAKAKGGKKLPEPVEEEEEEEGGEVIRCVCGDNVDHEDEIPFIACDTCEAWQHNVCMDVPLDESALKDHYYCEQCDPNEHKDLLEAMARGEKPWEARKQAWYDSRQKGKKGKKAGRRSAGKVNSNKDNSVQPAETEKATPRSTPKQTPVPSADGAGTKRKFEEETKVSGSPATKDPITDVGKPAEEGANGQAATSTTPASGRAEKKRKPSTKDTASSDTATSLVDIPLLPRDRQNVAIALEKLVKDGLDSKLKAGTLTPAEGKTTSMMARRFAQVIEYELFMVHGEPSKGSGYGAQFRAINANFKKNPVLLDRLLDHSMTPAELAKMSSDDMASEELKKQREKMKEEADKQAVMVRDDEKPRVRRTHKGEEYVDEAGNATSDSVFTSKPVRRRESEIEAEGAGSPSAPSAAAASPRTISGPSPIDTSRPDQRRQSSQNFDINNVWAKTAASPDHADAPSSRPPAPTNGNASQQATPQNKVTGDADIDRMLADDNDNDNDDYAPTDIKSGDGEVIWRGKFTQPGITSLTVSARHVAGNDFSRFLSWHQFLPSQFEIEGRLEKSKADDYLCGLQWSKKSDVSVLALSPYDSREAFDTIFTYFHSRSRYAVGKKAHGCSDIIKDLYISPVEANSAPPPHIELLDFCSLKFPLPERILLATFVVNKPAHWDQSDAMPVPQEASYPASRMSLPGPAASPINTQGPSFSPSTRQGFTPDQAAFPPNPYNATPPVPAPTALAPPPQQQQRTSPPQAAAPTSAPFNAAAPGMLVPQDQLAAQILAPFMQCPVAQQILTATNGMVKETEARNMRDIFEKEAAARDSMEVFAGILGAMPQGLGG